MRHVLALSAVAVVALAVSGFRTASATPGTDGAQLFRMRCGACHSVERGKAAGAGPNLFGLSGREAASTSFSYSPALRASRLTWDKTTLNRFLAAPGKTVPGTRMVMALPDAAQRKAVIDYLIAGR